MWGCEFDVMHGVAEMHLAYQLVIEHLRVSMYVSVHFVLYVFVFSKWQGYVL